MTDKTHLDENEELVEFKADGENSATADPVSKGSNKRKADKAGTDEPGPQGGKTVTPGTENGGDLIHGQKRMSKSPKRGADKQGTDAPGTPSVATPGQGGSEQAAPGHVKEEVMELFSGEDLSEEFIDKAVTIFEAAVHLRVTEAEATLREELEAEFALMEEQFVEDQSKRVEEYIDYVAEAWMEENQVAVTSALKVEMAESFISGLRSLFEQHNIELPEGAPDVVEEMQAQIDELQSKLDEEIDDKITMKNELDEAVRENAFLRVADGLADTQIDKLRTMSEGIDYEDAVDYEKKLNTLKESYFSSKTAVVAESLEDDEPVELDEQVIEGHMGRYAQAISRTAKR